MAAKICNLNFFKTVLIDLLTLFTLVLMKTLFIVRHAKSSWEDISVGDFDRPLNERGKKDAPRMGKRLKEKEIHPELMLTSPAKRAFSTCEKIAKILGYTLDKIKTDRRLYHASEEEIVTILSNLKDKCDSVMIFGHNPGLTEFVNTITDGSNGIDNIPTCGVIALTLPIDSWSELGKAKGKMLFFDYPKSRED
jgi:phosphohistidine phosphatase